jgi:hypothetical protein
MHQNASHIYVGEGGANLGVACTVAAAEETGVKWRRRERRQGLRVLGWKRNDTEGGLLFIGLKIPEAGFKLEPLLIVLQLIRSGSSLKTVSDDGIIRNGSKLEPLPISWTLNNNNSSYELLLIYGLTTVQDKPLLIGCIL